MSIDPLSEQVISLRDAAKVFSKNTVGKHPHISAIYRYTTTGCRGIILESVQAGSVRCTSREAVARFINALTEQVELPKRREPSESKAADDAGQILDATLFASRRKDSSAGTDGDQGGHSE